MVTDFYGTILDELSKAFEIDPLKPDENNTCLLRFANGFEVYIEMEQGEKHVLIGSTLGPVAAGRYREDVFRNALIANAQPYPRYGTFAYSKEADSLALFELIPIENLTGAKVAEVIAPLIQKGVIWKETLERGDVPKISIPGTSTTPSSGMFGL